MEADKLKELQMELAKAFGVAPDLVRVALKFKVGPLLAISVLVDGHDLTPEQNKLGQEVRKRVLGPLLHLGTYPEKPA